MRNPLWLLFLGLLSCTDPLSESVPPPPQSRAQPLLSRDGQHRILWNGSVAEVPAINIYDLAYKYAIVGRAAGQQKLREAALEGFKVVRFFAGGNYDEQNIRFPVIDLWRNDRVRFHQSMSALLDDANALGVQVVPSLFTGVAEPSEYDTYRATCPEFFLLALIPGTQNQALMKQFVADWVATHRAHPAIGFWELGNELNLAAKERNPARLCTDRQQLRTLMAELAALIKQNDPNHLVASGAMQEDAGDGLPLGSVAGTFNDAADFFTFYNDIPHIDITAVHIYGDRVYRTPSGATVPMADFLKYFRDLSWGMGRAFWVGEFGLPNHGCWYGNGYDPSTMSLLLARHHLGIQLAAAWAWQTREYGPAGTCPTAQQGPHPEMTAFSLDPGEDADALAAMREIPLRMGNASAGQQWWPFIGDFDGDRRADLAAKSSRGLIQVSLMGATPNSPSQWMPPFGDGQADPGGAPFLPLRGDWNGDGKTDLGLKARDGRWYTALSDGTRFTYAAHVLSNLGSESADPSGAPFQPLSGDWNGDGRTDLGLKTRDGRWFISLSSGAGFGPPAQVLSNFGNDSADPGGAPFTALTGDWNGDGKTDIGLKARDGRWYTATSTGSGFVGTALVLSGFGNDFADPGGAPFQPLTGDWNKDGRTDIGLKARDGRWYTATSTGSGFVGTALVLSGFGNEALDPGAAPLQPLTGDWNADGMTDIGLLTRDGRWYTATSTGSGFTGTTEWLR
jgi:hypothetical protein